MLLVPTHVAPSAIQGIGLFSTGFVAAGTPVWKFREGFDLAISPATVASLPEVAAAHVWRYAYRDDATGHWILGGDHTRFMNHDPRPNTGALPGATGPVVTVALRDIAAGEEITCDYHAFDGTAPEKVGPSPRAGSLDKTD